MHSYKIEFTLKSGVTVGMVYESIIHKDVDAVIREIESLSSTLIIRGKGVGVDCGPVVCVKAREIAAYTVKELNIPRNREENTWQ